MNKEVVLASGAKLKITSAPFAISKNLYQTFLEDIRGVYIDENATVGLNLYKDLLSVALSSKRMELALKPCLESVAYNGLKPTDDVFETVEAREDYFTVCFEVAWHNIAPFTKHLSQQSEAIIGLIGALRESTSKKTTS